MFALTAYGSTDSVAVYHRPEKVIVMVNEYGQAPRLNTVLTAFAQKERLIFETADFSMKCAKGRQGIGCNLRLLPFGDGKIGAKDAAWQGATDAQDFAVEFEGSRGHYLQLSAESGILSFHSRRP